MAKTPKPGIKNNKTIRRDMRTNMAKLFSRKIYNDIVLKICIHMNVDLKIVIEGV